MRVLVIDDEETILKTFKFRLSAWGHEVLVANEGNKGLEILRSIHCDVVIVDLKMPGISGEELVPMVHEEFPDTEIVVITGYATIDSAVNMMKSGASEFFTKPLDFEQIRIVLEKIKKRLALREENIRLRDKVKELRSHVSGQYRFHNLIGKSKVMQEIFNLIAAVAPLDSTVTIYGETGTGKEEVAKAIHYNSPRASGPLVIVDCGILSETLLESELFGHEKGAFTGAIKSKRGKFELAHGGTIFLDEIANASPKVQKKLLRVIQEKTFERLGGEKTIKVDVRIIAACNRDLSQLVKEGVFREDLFYRLNVVPIYLPPLRKRKEDIPLLARYFLDMFTRQIGKEPMDLTPEAIEQLMHYSWPGNIRELMNVMERIAVMNSDKVVKSIPISMTKPIVGELEQRESKSVSLEPPLKDQIASLEFNYLKLALKTYRGRIKDVSKQSGLSTRTIYRKMKQYGLDKRDFR